MDHLPFQQLLEHGNTAIIKNPLRRVPEDHLTTYIESFFKKSGLENVIDIATLVRGARLARDQEAFIAEGNREGSVTPVELAALKKEKFDNISIWTEARELKIILLTCCVGSILHGWVSQLLPSQECLT